MKNKLLFILTTVVVNFLFTLNVNASEISVVAGSGCVEASKVALEGVFTVGYKTTFETIGTDVKITFELLDTDKSGVVAFLRKQGDSPSLETSMTNVSGNIFTKTITGQTPGAIISYGVKFAFAGGLAVTKFVNYEVGTDCAGTNDVVAPTNFTATIGAITSSSVEIVLNATDISGTILYSVSYGTVTKSITSESGVQKSFVITALAPDTDYSFSVTAKDLVGNIAAGSPIVRAAKTLISTNTECAGTASDAQSGDSFSVGYKYAFQTINGTDVKITFELLDNKGVELAYLWRQSPFSETGPMAKSGKIVTSTITGQTPGATISYAVKFIFVGGGAAVTKYFSYVVGNTCSLGVETPSEMKQVFYPNPVKNKFYMQLLDEKNKIMVTDILGRKLHEGVVSASTSLDMSAFKTGVYFLKVENSYGTENVKIIKE